MNTRAKGSCGEDIAVEYLVSMGYSIITRNYQSKNGEIDCIAEAPDATLVFVEVKSAESMSRGHPFSWVTRRKQLTLISMARTYLADHAITSRPCRFDVIAVIGGKVDHLKNAFLV